jgi:hypothetical protein
MCERVAKKGSRKLAYIYPPMVDSPSLSWLGNLSDERVILTFSQRLDQGGCVDSVELWVS